MYCTNCGKPIPNDSGFCENCGAKVSTPQSENVQSQTAVPKAESSQNETTTPETESSQNETAAPKANGQPAAAAEKKAKFFTPGKIALYVLALLAVVLLIWGIVSAASHSDKTAAEPTAFPTFEFWETMNTTALWKKTPSSTETLTLLIINTTVPPALRWRKPKTPCENSSATSPINRRFNPRAVLGPIYRVNARPFALFRQQNHRWNRRLRHALSGCLPCGCP